MRARGRVFKYGDDVNTDVIFPGKYTYTIKDPAEMAKHALEDLDPEFAKNVKKGDLIVAGRNFGCGSSREQAATCLKKSGLAAIIARSYSRIFFRNGVNEGLALIECAAAVDAIAAGDEVEIDFEAARVTVPDGRTFAFPTLPESVLGILRDGGLIAHLKKKLAAEKATGR